jgi:hypothetical protein
MSKVSSWACERKSFTLRSSDTEADRRPLTADRRLPAVEPPHAFRPLRLRPLAQPPRAGPGARAGRREAHPRPDRIEPHAGRPALPRARHPGRPGPPGSPSLRADPVRPRRGAPGRRPRPVGARAAGRPRPPAAHGQHQRGLRLPLQAPLRSGRRGPRPPPELPAVRAPRATRGGARRAVPPRVRRGVACRPRVAAGRRLGAHPRRRRRQPQQPDRLVRQALRARRALVARLAGRERRGLRALPAARGPHRAPSPRWRRAVRRSSSRSAASRSSPRCPR